MKFNRRYAIYAGLFLLLLVNYTDRIVLSVAAGGIASTYHLSAVALGYLFSAYTWTYTLCLVPAGLTIDRWGIRRVIAGATIVWSIGGMLTGVATSFITLLAARLVLGVGEASSFPGGARVLREWAPRTERAFATGIFNAGAYLGPAIALPLIGWIIALWGWRASFYITGLIGIVFGILWFLAYRTPERARWISAAERSRILADRDYTDTADKRPPSSAILKTILSSPTMWALAVTQGCAGYTIAFFLSWMPRYFEIAYRIDIARTSSLTALPYLISGILLVIISKVSDRIIDQAGIRNGKRRNIVAANLLVASSIVFVPYVSNVAVIVALFGISLACVASTLSLNSALVNDLLKNSEASATAVGFTYTIGNVTNIISPVVTGYVVARTGEFRDAFVISAVLLCIGALVSFAFTRGQISFIADETEAMRAGNINPQH